MQEYGRHLQQLQTIAHLQSDLLPTSTDANTSQLAGRNLAKLEQLYAHHAQRLAELEKNPRLQNLAQQTLTELAPTEPENVENSQNEDVDNIRTYDRIQESTSFQDSDNGTRKLARAQQMLVNAKEGAASEIRLLTKFCSNWVGTKRQITIKTSVGKVRVDAIGQIKNDDGSYTVVIAEFKSSKTARLTRNQRTVFPEIAKNGGVVVGKGKEGFRGGKVIPPGTIIQVVRELEGGGWYVSDRFGQG